MRITDDQPQFPEFLETLSVLNERRAEANRSGTSEPFHAFGQVMLDLYRISRRERDAVSFRTSLGFEYLTDVCPKLNLPCALHSEMLSEILEDEPEDEDVILKRPLLYHVLQWPWPWFRLEDTIADPLELDFINRSLAEQTAYRVSMDLTFLWCRRTYGEPDDQTDPRLEMEPYLLWLKRLQKELPPHNRIPYLLMYHMSEVLDSEAGLMWLALEEQNHPDCPHLANIRESLLHPPKSWRFGSQP